MSTAHCAVHRPQWLCLGPGQGPPWHENRLAHHLVPHPGMGTPSFLTIHSKQNLTSGSSKPWINLTLLSSAATFIDLKI